MSSYTVADCVNRAARRLRIVPGGDTLQAEDQADALAAYNSMMFGFSVRGLTLTDEADAAYTHAIQAWGDDFPLGDEHFDAIWQVLMEKLIGQFPIDQSVAQTAAVLIADGWNRLYAAFFVRAEADVSSVGLLPTQTDKFWMI